MVNQAIIEGFNHANSRHAILYLGWLIAVIFLLILLKHWEN